MFDSNQVITITQTVAPLTTVTIQSFDYKSMFTITNCDFCTFNQSFSLDLPSINFIISVLPNLDDILIFVLNNPI